MLEFADGRCEYRLQVPADLNTTRWFLRPDVATGIRRYGDEALVFNPHSWQTHVLNPAAALVLCALDASPRSITALRESLALELSDDDLQVLNEAAMLELLEQLESMQLVQREDEA